MLFYLLPQALVIASNETTIEFHHHAISGMYSRLDDPFGLPELQMDSCAGQGWKFVCCVVIVKSCVNWLLIGCTRMKNRSKARWASWLNSWQWLGTQNFLLQGCSLVDVGRVKKADSYQEWKFFNGDGRNFNKVAFEFCVWWCNFKQFSCEFWIFVDK